MIVVDAGVVLALLLPLPFSGQASEAMRAARTAGHDFFAPALLEYEVCSALRRTVAHGLIDQENVDKALGLVEALRIRAITPAASLHARALDWATRLQHSKAYDSQYLALAEQMRCDLLTSDERLARAARAHGASWVKSLAPLV